MAANIQSQARDAVQLDGFAPSVERIRSILQKHGRLGIDAMALAENDDLYAAGLNSLASVNVMLALESEFSVEFPDSMLNRSMFASIGAIRKAVQKASGS